MYVIIISESIFSQFRKQCTKVPFYNFLAWGWEQDDLRLCVLERNGNGELCDGLQFPKLFVMEDWLNIIGFFSENE